MIIKVIVGIIVIFFAVLIYACCVASGRAEERDERMWQDYMEKLKEENELTDSNDSTTVGD